jgi:hypothetical protein
MGFVHQPVEPATAIEQRVLGVQMEMNKVCMRHDYILRLVLIGSQARDIHRQQERGRLVWQILWKGDRAARLRFRKAREQGSVRRIYAFLLSGCKYYRVNEREPIVCR